MHLHFILHGGIILLLGLITGFPYTRAIIKCSGTEAAWRLVHSASSMGGIWLIAMGVVFVLLSTPVWLSWAWLISSVLSVYAFFIGMLAAAITGKRGLEKRNSKIDFRIHLLYSLGTITSLLAALFFLIAVARNM